MTRKPIGVTTPYRKIGQEELTLKLLDKQIKALTERVNNLEKQNAQTKQVQTEGRTP